MPIPCSVNESHAWHVSPCPGPVHFIPTYIRTCRFIAVGISFGCISSALLLSVVFCFHYLLDGSLRVVSVPGCF